jgi:hypothetical protein
MTRRGARVVAGRVLHPYTPLPGSCRWCRCTYDDPCPQGCGWADAAQTLCTACTALERAWTHLEAAHLPNMRRAFYRGYLAGSDDERALDQDTNPYRADGTTARYWDLGHRAGAR